MPSLLVYASSDHDSRIPRGIADTSFLVGIAGRSHDHHVRSDGPLDCRLIKIIWFLITDRDAQHTRPLSHRPVNRVVEIHRAAETSNTGSFNRQDGCLRGNTEYTAVPPDQTCHRRAVAMIIIPAVGVIAEEFVGTRENIAGEIWMLTDARINHTDHNALALRNLMNLRQPKEVHVPLPVRHLIGPGRDRRRQQSQHQPQDRRCPPPARPGRHRGHPSILTTPGGRSSWPDSTVGGEPPMTGATTSCSTVHGSSGS